MSLWVGGMCFQCVGFCFQVNSAVWTHVIFHFGGGKRLTSTSQMAAAIPRHSV